jgi:S-DNA-T family DNA segregation ATPase FtsK/SpoIIIE
MARTAQRAMRGFGGRVRFWGDVLSSVKYRVFEVLGALLVLASLLLLLALLTYFPGDASFDTAVAAPPRNYLGYDGAVIADILMQSIGFAAYLVPAVLLGWAFRLMLRRPIPRFARRCAVLLATLILGALACSVLQVSGGPPAGAGGAVGWALLRLITSVGLAPLALPIAMAASAFVALLLLSVIGLSAGDWRVIGGGAGRGAAGLARATGHGTRMAAAFGGQLWRSWRAAPRTLDDGPKAESFQTVVSRKPPAETRDARVTPLPTRREPKLGLVPPMPAARSRRRPRACRAASCVS